MSEEEIKAALSIETIECGDMCGTWTEIRLLFNGEVISTDTLNHKSCDD